MPLGKGYQNTRWGLVDDQGLPLSADQRSEYVRFMKVRRTALPSAREAWKREKEALYARQPPEDRHWEWDVRLVNGHWCSPFVNDGLPLEPIGVAASVSKKFIPCRRRSSLKQLR